MAEAAVLAVVTALAPTVAELLIKATVHLASSSRPSGERISREMRRIRKEFEQIESLLSYADRWEEHDELVKDWVREVRGVAQEVEDILDEHSYDSFSGVGGGAVGLFHRAKHGFTKGKATGALADRLEAIRPEVEKICNIRDTLLQRKLERFLVPPAQPRCWYNDLDPRRAEWERLHRWITTEELAESSSAARSLARRLSITVAGASGQGKTTLVRKIYDDLQESNLFDRRAWVAVSGITNDLDLLRKLALQLCEENDHPCASRAHDAHHTADPDVLVRMIHSAIQQRRFIIVFDDVCADDFWGKIESWFGVGHDRRSRILLTTRHDSVASSSSREQGRVLTMGPLSDAAAWSLFCSKSFGTVAAPPELQSVGREIVKRCKGLLLPIVAAAIVMSTKERSLNAWNMAYETLKLDLHKQPASSDSILMHSYYELPSHLKRCFMYCAMFPAGMLIKRKQLVRLWVAEGFIQEEAGKTVDQIAGSYLEELIERRMIIMERQNESGRVKACRIHDSYRKVMLEISSAQNFLMVHDGSGRALGIGKNTRRLSLHNVVSANLTNRDDSTRLRSLLLFHNVSKSILSWNYTLLKVLDLSDVPIAELPKWIFKMYLLRYLGLRNTKIRVNEFPKEIEDLQQLRTLDLWKTEVKSLPRNILKLENLEHLMLFHTINPRDMKYHNPLGFRGRDAPKHMWDMQNLQTLKIIAATDELVENLGHLANLRTLSITGVTTEQCVPLFECLCRMGHLRRLVVRAKEGNRLRFSTAGSGSGHSPFPSLQKLQLHGEFEGSPEWFQGLQHLTHLYLFESRSADRDLLRNLQSLPSLAFLVLDRAYVEMELSFGPRSFPSLRILIMDELAATSIVADGNALPRLRKLYVRGCKNLKGGSWRGVEKLAALREIVLRDHARELEDFLRPICGRRNVRLTIAEPML